MILRVFRISETSSSHEYYDVDESRIRLVCKRHGILFSKLKQMLSKRPHIHTIVIDMKTIDSTWLSKSNKR